MRREIPRFGLREALRRGEIIAGPILPIPSPALVELAGHAGFDFICLDAQHGAFGIETAEHLVRAAESAGIAPIVRVPDTNVVTVMKYLDLGAQGILFPDIESPEAAESAVKSVKYAPEGTRGSCPSVRAAGFQAYEWAAVHTRANTDTLVCPIVETVRGFDACDEILAVPGIDAVLFGPFDLSASLGHPGDLAHPDVVRLLDRGVEAAQRRGVPICAWALGVDGLNRWYARGARMFLPSYTTILLDAVQAAAQSLRAFKAGLS